MSENDVELINRINQKMLIENEKQFLRRHLGDPEPDFCSKILNDNNIHEKHK